MTLERDHAQALDEPASLTGPVAAEVSNALVRLFRDHYGKGPTQAKTLLHDDIVVTVLRGGFTRAEKRLLEAGRVEVVEDGRRAMQDVLEAEMRAAVEKLTGRRVAAFMSANHHDPDASVEVFLLEPADHGRNGGRAPAEGDEG